jgi:uncharacterized protein YyaL (SSP411 family)
LRFYPFVFAADADTRPVFAVRMEGARFAETELATHLSEEVEVTVRSNNIDLYDLFAGKLVVLEAEAVTADWAAYDLDDFTKQIERLQAENQRLNGALSRAIEKHRKLTSVVGELMRRAEIKAAASNEHKARQAAAIEVLERTLRELEDEG